ncbi:hypothetical protein, partial [Candidatus Ichthyocystis sparus]|uniref:hypothetical protein n=1 Tax=Candidatus Ichthyocystis sparus TaxID=1561004 RepID=UPI000A6C6671
VLLSTYSSLVFVPEYRVFKCDIKDGSIGKTTETLLLLLAHPGIRVLSSTSDCELVTLSGGVLLDFLSKLDCAAFNVVQPVFESQWDVVADRVFAKLEDGSLSDVSCEDVISVLDIAGIPASAFSALQRQIRTARGKASGNSSSKVASGGATLVSATTGLVSPSSSSQLQSELLSQSGPELLSEGTGPYLPIVTKTITQRRVISESKISGDSSKCAESTGSGSRAVDFIRHLAASLPRIKFQHELSSQPPVTETVSQRRVISKGKTSEGSSKCADACSTTLTHSSVISSARLRSELPPQSETQLRSLSPFGPLVGEVSPAPSFQSSISFAPLPLSSSLSTSESGPQSQHEMQLVSLSGECFSRISADVSVSTLEGDASDLRALEDGASSSASDSVVAVPPSSVSAFAPLSVTEPLSAPASELLVASDISSFLLPLAEGLSMPTVSDQSGVISTSVALPGVESSSPVDGYIAVPTPSVGSFLDISGDVLVSTAEGVASDLGERELPASEMVAAFDISPSLSPSAEVLDAIGVASSAFMHAGDDSLSPPSSPSILPPSSPSILPSSSSLSSSSSSSSSLSLCVSGLDADVSSSSTESSLSSSSLSLYVSGLDADVSSSSTESSVLGRAIVGLATEVIASESRVLVG